MILFGAGCVVDRSPLFPMKTRQMNSTEKEMSLTINAMLMAFHYDDRKAFRAMIEDSDDPMNLLVGCIAVLKNMLDSMVALVDANVDESEITFEAMVQARGEYLMDLDTED